MKGLARLKLNALNKACFLRYFDTGTVAALMPGAQHRNNAKTEKEEIPRDSLARRRFLRGALEI